MLPESDQIVPSYFLLRELGDGGMGTVYAAKHRSEDYAARQGEVAIKVLDQKLAKREDIRKRFEREAMLLKDLDHSGIVKGHELLYLPRSLALVMRRVPGRALDRVIGTETGPIPWGRASQIFAPLCEAVAYLHGKSVIHRDLKPDNIMLTPDDRPVLLDLGIAKQLVGGNTQTGTGMGTIAYMAPEQYTNAKAVDSRADIYALGMTLYEMLAGRLPWEAGTTDFIILERKKNGDIPPPTDFYPDIPPRVVAAVMEAIAVAPVDRPSSVAELHALLTGKGRTVVQSPAELPGRGDSHPPVSTQGMSSRSARDSPEELDPPIHYRSSFGLAQALGVGVLVLGLGLVFYLGTSGPDLSRSRSIHDDDDDDDDDDDRAAQKTAVKSDAEPGAEKSSDEAESRSSKSETSSSPEPSSHSDSIGDSIEQQIRNRSIVELQRMTEECEWDDDPTSPDPPHDAGKQTVAVEDYTGDGRRDDIATVECHNNGRSGNAYDTLYMRVLVYWNGREVRTAETGVNWLVAGEKIGPGTYRSRALDWGPDDGRCCPSLCFEEVWKWDGGLEEVIRTQRREIPYDRCN